VNLLIDSYRARSSLRVMDQITFVNSDLLGNGCQTSSWKYMSGTPLKIDAGTHPRP